MSIDSVHCHANFGKSLGGISFPLLADFHPKGAVATAFGVYLGGAGITDRATVIVDANGVVQYAASVSPSGERNIDELAQRCEALDAQHSLTDRSPSPGIEGATLFVRSSCGFSRAVLLAVDNLHLGATLAIRNVNDDAAAMKDLKRLTGGVQAPALAHGGLIMLESNDIIAHLVATVRPL